MWARQRASVAQSHPKGNVLLSSGLRHADVFLSANNPTAFEYPGHKRGGVLTAIAMRGTRDPM
jgi:hypothetical protein